MDPSKRKRASCRFLGNSNQTNKQNMQQAKKVATKKRRRETTPVPVPVPVPVPLPPTLLFEDMVSEQLVQVAEEDEHERKADAEKQALHALRVQKRRIAKKKKQEAVRAVKRQKLKGLPGYVYRFVLGLDISVQSPGIALYDRVTQSWSLLAWRQRKTDAADDRTILHKDTPIHVCFEPEDPESTMPHLRIRRMRAKTDRILEFVKERLDALSYTCFPRAIERLIEGYAGILSTPICVIEEYAYHISSSAMTPLAEIGGIIRMQLELEEWDWIELNPSSIKLGLSGKGDADKMDMWQAFSRIYGWPLHTWCLVDKLPDPATSRKISTPLQDLVDAVGIVYSVRDNSAVLKKQRQR